MIWLAMVGVVLLAVLFLDNDLVVTGFIVLATVFVLAVVGIAMLAGLFAIVAVAR